MHEHNNRNITKLIIQMDYHLMKRKKLFGQPDILSIDKHSFLFHYTLIIMHEHNNKNTTIANSIK